MSVGPTPKRWRLPLFSTRQVVATPGALRLLEQAGVNPMDLLVRHVHGDWGDLEAEDKEANRLAAELGGRILSSYEVRLTSRIEKVWIITEADRSSTCVLLPRDY